MIWFLISQAYAKSGPAVFPLASTDKGEVYVTFNDINQLKIMFLIFALSASISLIKWLVGLFTKTEQRSREAMDKRLTKLEDGNDEILIALQELKIHFQHMKSDQVNSDQVRQIARDEITYLQKTRERK